MALPRFVRVRQHLATDSIADIEGAVRSALAETRLDGRIRPGWRVALTAGSRGITAIDQIIGAVAAEVRRIGAEPFVVPAMGSHGGATAEGQREMLAEFGITEERLGLPIRASMDTVELGRTPGGVPVYFDRIAAEADATIVIGRVKAHTAFKGPIESGLCKMIAVGLGKHRGAIELHRAGLRDTIPEAARVALDRANIALGLAIVENAHDRPFRFVAAPPERIHETDRELLQLSNELLPRVPIDPLDVLVIDWMGKNLSGTGMDLNILGIWRRIGGEPRPFFNRIVVLNLTPESHGNATGIGMADFTTRRLFDRIDLEATYTNILTANFPAGGKIPILRRSDREAIETALTSAVPAGEPRIVRIPSTLHLSEMSVSEGLLPEVRTAENLEILSEPEPLAFDAGGNLTPLPI